MENPLPFLAPLGVDDHSFEASDSELSVSLCQVNLFPFGVLLFMS